MAEEAYEIALRRAVAELAEVDRQAEEIERRRAMLRQSVAVLQTLAGDQPDQERSVTSSILTILKASPGPLPTSQIIQRLVSMGHAPQATSVATLLSRLSRDGKIMKADDGYLFRPATVPETISTFLRLHTQEAYCDKCIALSLQLSRPQQVQQVTSSLATQDGYVREKGKCALCHKNVSLIHAV
jgi:hypothetical protein